jgi:predicted ribosomally synthesized peptide with nif11-like leader
VNQELDRFRSRLNEDPDLQRRIRAGENPLDVAQQLGFDVTREDFASAVRDDQVELTEFELEMVSGGKEMSEASDSWSKIKGMFGDDNGMADTTEQLG